MAQWDERKYVRDKAGRFANKPGAGRVAEFYGAPLHGSRQEGAPNSFYIGRNGQGYWWPTGQRDEDGDEVTHQALYEETMVTTEDAVNLKPSVVTGVPGEELPDGQVRIALSKDLPLSASQRAVLRKEFPGRSFVDSQGNAVDPYADEVKEGRDAIRWADQEYAGFRGKLTEGEHFAVEQYADRAHAGINSNLRKGRPQSGGHLSHLDSAMAKAPPTSAPVRVYRGNKWPALLGALGDGTAEGMEFEDKGFSSTSLEPEIARLSGGVQTSFVLPKGSKAIYVPDFNLHQGAGEEELLVDRGMRFRVAGAEQREGQWYVDLEVIDG